MSSPGATPPLPRHTVCLTFLRALGTSLLRCACRGFVVGAPLVDEMSGSAWSGVGVVSYIRLRRGWGSQTLVPCWVCPFSFVVGASPTCGTARLPLPGVCPGGGPPLRWAPVTSGKQPRRHQWFARSPPSTETMKQPPPQRRGTGPPEHHQHARGNAPGVCPKNTGHVVTVTPATNGTHHHRQGGVCPMGETTTAVTGTAAGGHQSAIPSDSTRGNTTRAHQRGAPPPTPEPGNRRAPHQHREGHRRRENLPCRASVMGVTTPRQGTPDPSKTERAQVSTDQALPGADPHAAGTSDTAGTRSPGRAQGETHHQPKGTPHNTRGTTNAGKTGRVVDPSPTCNGTNGNAETGCERASIRVSSGTG